MNAALTNWKTTLAGIAVGLLLAALTVYQPGMSWKSWCAAAVVAAIGALPGILAHDGFIPKAAPVLLLCLLLGSVAMAQTPAVVSQPWSATTSVLSLPGNNHTIAASDSGIAFTPTPNLDLFDRNLITTDGTMKYFAGGVNYRIAWLNKKLDSISPNVNFLRVQTFVTASAGIDQVTLAGVTANHYGFTAGGGANYMLNVSGSWTLGGSVEWAKFPGYQNNGLIVKFGPTFHF